MIIPSVRARIREEDLDLLRQALDLHPVPDSVLLVQVWRERGFEEVLLHPSFEPRFLWEAVSLRSPGLPFLWYASLRHAFSARGIEDADLVDYVSTLIYEFGQGDRAFRIDGGRGARTEYLVDLLEAAERGVPGANQHLGDLALWMAGLFPDRVEGRRQRRGAPGLPYFDAMGRMGYLAAASEARTRKAGWSHLFVQIGDVFPLVRRTLNSFSDTHFFPGPGSDPVNRLLRQVGDEWMADA